MSDFEAQRECDDCHAMIPLSEHWGSECPGCTARVRLCGCGRLVYLSSGWANACACGTEYNGAGQQLAPRCQWGEETGEYDCGTWPDPAYEVCPDDY